MMIKITMFPYLLPPKEGRENPYIRDFVSSLNSSGEAQVVNKPHKNPLLSILSPRRWGDVVIFNWFESIPDFKYGLLQSCAAVTYLAALKIAGVKIVWMVHNRVPHASGRRWLKKSLMWLMAHGATRIVTHARDGLAVVRSLCPAAVGRTTFLHHPTKDRLDWGRRAGVEKYDLLVWGQIARYKGVLDFIQFMHDRQITHITVCIVGRCASAGLRDEIRAKLLPNMTLIDESPSFEALGRYVAQARFVLAPYRPESILSSGMLMDSLSFGAKVIGPDTGSFKDYAAEPRLKVYTYRTFGDIPAIVERYGDIPADRESYKDFLEKQNWTNFTKELIAWLKR